MRGLIDRKGEQFAYLQGSTLYTLEGEPTGQLRGTLSKIWRATASGAWWGMASIRWMATKPSAFSAPPAMSSTTFKFTKISTLFQQNYFEMSCSTLLIKVKHPDQVERDSSFRSASFRMTNHGA